MKKAGKGTKGVILALILALVVVIGGTYAWLRLTVNGTQENVIKAGTFSLVLDDSATEGIKLENAIPISDVKGLATDAYTFTLENTGNMDADFKIYLDDVALDEGVTRMDDKYVKYSLTVNNGTATTQLLTNIKEDGKTSRLLTSGTLTAKSTNTYTLRLWINKDADNGVMGSVFYGQIRVEAVQYGGTYDETQGAISDTTNDAG